MNAPDAADSQGRFSKGPPGSRSFRPPSRPASSSGGQRGRGFIAAQRHDDTDAWSAPAFLTLTGGSIGLQVGAQSVDVILLIQNRRGLTRLLDNQFKLGVETRPPSSDRSAAASKPRPISR